MRLAWSAAAAVALAAACVVLVRTARPSMESLRTIDISWSFAAAASVVWLLTFGFLVATWAQSLAWWNQRIDLRGALHIFFMSNLARYVPGAVWQFAGLAAMASARRVSPLAATAGILVQQMMLLLTGGVIAVAAAPRLLGGWTSDYSPALLVGVAIAGFAALVIAMPTVLDRARPMVEKRLGGRLTLPVMSQQRLAGYVIRTALAWLGYGVAFWLLGRALYGAAAPSLFDAAAAFIGASVLGIAAVFAPGGIIVREAAIAGALTPALGLERATLLAIASRVWMIALEIAGALVMLAWSRLRPASPEPG